MKKLNVAVFIIIIFLLQFSVFGVFIRLERIPNLFIAFAVSLIIFFGFEKSLPWIIIAGLAMDSGSSWMIGSGTIILVVISWLLDKLKIIAELRSKRYLFAFLLAFLVILSSSIFDILVFAAVSFEKQSGVQGITIPEIRVNLDYLMKLAYAAIFGIAIYYLARRIKTEQYSGILVRK
jgi:hypothetical protein